MIKMKLFRLFVIISKNIIYSNIVLYIKMVDKEVSIYFMMIIDSMLKYFENKYNEKEKIKKYKLSFDDEFVML